MKIRVIANTHQIGGGEFSSAWISRTLSEDGHDVTIHPAKPHIHHSYKVGPKVKRGEPFEMMTERKCDLLVLYGNNTVLDLERLRDRWELVLNSAARKVVVLNWRCGQAIQPWFHHYIDKFLFLSSRRMYEFLFESGYRGETNFMAPPVDLTEFLKIPIAENPDVDFLWVGKGSKMGEKALWIMEQVMPKAPKAHWHYMEAKADLVASYKQNENVLLNKMYQMHVHEFLAKGSVFWYRCLEDVQDQGPRVVVEAMAAGRPCIVNEIWGLADRVNHDTGWPCRNDQEFVTTMMQIVDDPGIIVPKAEAARQYAIEHFNPRQWIAEILDKDVSNATNRPRKSSKPKKQTASVGSP